MSISIRDVFHPLSLPYLNSEWILRSIDSRIEFNQGEDDEFHLFLLVALVERIGRIRFVERKQVLLFSRKRIGVLRWGGQQFRLELSDYILELHLTYEGETQQETVLEMRTDCAPFLHSRRKLSPHTSDFAARPRARPGNALVLCARRRTARSAAGIEN